MINVIKCRKCGSVENKSVISRAGIVRERIEASKKMGRLDLFWPEGNDR